DYYNEALKRDSGDSRINTVTGVRFAKEGNWALAEKHLLRAIERQTRYYTITKDPEAYYNLGVAYHFQKKYKEAADCFWKATWYPTFQSPAYFGLAQIECAKGDYNKALEYIDASLQVNARNTKAITLKAYILRRLGNNAAAGYIDDVLSIDPLDYWALSEKSILKGKGAAFLKEAEKTRGEGLIRLQELLEIAVDYATVGAYDEALSLLDEAVALGAPYADSPLVYYYAGYYASLKNNKPKALQYYTKAKGQPSDYCFPFRLEEIALFEQVIQDDPKNDKAYYYQGNLLYYLNQKEKAVEAWKASEKLNPEFSLTLRNLGFALNREGKKEVAAAYYKKAIENDTANPLLPVEADKLYEQLRLPAGERLALLQQHIKTAMSHDDAVIRMLALYNETGRYDDAISILQNRHFHVWEGGGLVHDIFVDSHLLKGLAYLNSGKFDNAVREFETADTYPENLEVGRPYNGGQYAKIYYYMGKAYQAKKQLGKAKACFEKSAAETVSISKREHNELDIYRALSCQELSDTEKASAIIESCGNYVNAQLNGSSILDEYSKFGEDGTHSEQLARLLYLKGLVCYAQNDVEQAGELFKQALEANPGLIWAKQFMEINFTRMFQNLK
ncbi:MAG: tetratricopeptide repeat protein, partial [Prevotellaceae bacterium]|nr:tetratricopeptide repeat protein [Prevotellaceae bacterium]